MDVYPEPSKSTDLVSPKEYVFVLNPNDVLFGRGLQAFTYKGNVSFRKLVCERKKIYTSSRNRNLKNQLVQEIIGIVTSRQGRFLHEVNYSDVAFKGKRVWLAADKKPVYRKVKQAMREPDLPSRSTLRGFIDQNRGCKLEFEPKNEESKDEHFDKELSETLIDLIKKKSERDISSDFKSFSDPEAITHILDLPQVSSILSCSYDQKTQLERQQIILNNVFGEQNKFHPNLFTQSKDVRGDVPFREELEINYIEKICKELALVSSYQNSVHNTMQDHHQSQTRCHFAPQENNLFNIITFSNLILKDQGETSFDFGATDLLAKYFENLSGINEQSSGNSTDQILRILWSELNH